MKKSYFIEKTEQSDSPLHSPLWQRAECGYVEEKNWAEFDYAPATRFYILSGSKGFSVKFDTEEHPVWMKYHSFNDPVNRDSCVEAFLNFNPVSTKAYMNFEINAAGTLQLGYGVNIRDRKKIWDVDTTIFNIKTEINEKGWRLKFFIPFYFIERYYKQVSPVFFGNLYKCAEGSPRPHYLTWQPIHTVAPDFHSSEYFGKIILKE